MSLKAYIPPVERAPQQERAVPGHTTIAPRGKRCSQCPCCDAVIAFEGEYLCAACDDGTHPPIAQYQPAPPMEMPAPVLEPLKEEKPMTIKSGRTGARNTPISPEIKRAVLAAPPTVSNSDLARKYKISDVTISTWRKAAGIVLAKGPRGPYKEHAAAEAERAPAPQKQEAEPAQVIRTHGTLALDRAQTQVTFVVNDGVLGAWWQRLTTSAKASIFQDNFDFAVQGAAR